MTFDASTLKQEADATLAAVRQAGDWLMHPKTVSRLGDQVPQLRRDLIRHSIAARRLAEAAGRPMGVAVFGESQVGKSHLVSVLARKGDTFLADLDGEPQPINYIDRINPDKGGEATGLVTRFTVRKTRAPAGFPVHVRLFDHADIVKILANAYHFDGFSRFESLPEREEISAHVAEFRIAADAQPVDNGLTVEDVWDIEQYLQRYVSDSLIQRRLKTSEFWAVASDVVPYLSVERLGKFFSILWGRHQPLSDLYVRLVTNLRQLKFPAEAFLPLSAIDLAIPGNISVLDVECMQDLWAPSGADIMVRTADGRSWSMPRPVVAALIAELVIRLAEQPWDWFAHTDIFDFPGYRSRGLTNKEVEEDEPHGPAGLARALADHPGPTISMLMLRGKVEYLFQRYVAEQEITAMLLCAKESNLNVRQLPEVVVRWIAATHGSTAAERAGKPVLLFFVFTRFDVHFEQKRSDEAMGLEVRFSGRMDNSFLKPHGSTPDTWVRDWAGGRPFRNCFLMRNPNFRNAVFDFEGVREAGVKPEHRDWIERLKAAFLAAPSVLAHFEDPARAFDEMLALNDGGSSYIAEKLALVCVPSMKAQQVEDRLRALRSRVTDLLKPHYVPTDLRRRIDERLAVADRVLDELEICDDRGRFGSLLQGFEIDATRLADHLYGAQYAEPPIDAGTVPSAPSMGRARPGRSTPTAAQPTVVVPVASISRRQATAAIEVWMMSLFDRAGHAGFSRETGVGTVALRELATELSTAARRLRLADRITALIERESFASDQRNLQLDKASLIAEQVVNGFVSDLGMSWRPASARPQIATDDRGAVRTAFAERDVAYDASGIGPEPARFRQRFVEDWLHAFYAIVEENAGSEEGQDVDPVLNARLGSIVEALSERV